MEGLGGAWRLSNGELYGLPVPCPVERDKGWESADRDRLLSARIESRAARSRNSPLDTTALTVLVLRMSSRGLAESITRSAAWPALIVPTWSRPRNLAGLLVAA